MRSITTLVTTAFLLAATPLAAQDRIQVATLNDTPIWLDEVMAVAEGLPAEYRQAGIGQLYPQLVAEVANSRLAAAAARAEGLDKDEQVLEAMRLAADRVLAETYIRNAVALEVTDAAIQQAYDTFAADTASREQVTASHILVETEEEANAIIVELNDGADFAQLAQDKSTGPSGPNGGALGTFGRGQMVPAFENAAFDMPPGSHSSKPVQTQFGWHVIKVTKKSTQPAPSLEEMSDQLAANISRQSFARIVEGLRAEADIEIRPFEDVLGEAEGQASTTNQ